MKLEAQLLHSLTSAHSAEVARLLESMVATDAAKIVEVLPDNACGMLLRWLSPIVAEQVLELVPDAKVAGVLRATRDDVAASVLRSAKRDIRVRWLEALEPKKQKAMRTLLRYAEGTAGALMDPQILTIAEGSSVGDALHRLRHASQGAFYYLYVVAQDNELVAVLTLTKALAASKNETIDSLATPKVETLSALASWDSIVAHPAWKRLHSLPVVDARGRFLGVVRYELLRKLEQELAQLDPEESSARTGAALGELYGVGLRALFAWLGSLGSGSNSATKGQL